MRIEQPVGTRGSLRWIQRAVAEQWDSLERPIATAGVAGEVEWVSPLAEDGYAEYRDTDFLVRVGLGHLAPELAEFWPPRGPQWDALGRSRSGAVILVEAKSHIAEFCTPGTSAGVASRTRIADRLGEVAMALGSRDGARWCDRFYQYANRIAHLHFLRAAGVDARLLLVGFLDDIGMDGPTSAEAWQAAYQVSDHALGLPRKHALTPFIIHAYPSVAGHD